MEGQLSGNLVASKLNRGRQASGDLIPWTISRYYLVSKEFEILLHFQDNNFAQLSGARIIRLAVHPDVQCNSFYQLNVSV